MSNPDERLVQRAVSARLLDPKKGQAALFLYTQLKQKGVKFSFGDFLANQGLLSQMALDALLAENEGADVGEEEKLRTVSVVGDYELLETLGEGENGVVFRAMQKSLQRIVALKILSSQIASDPEALTRFQNEARATAKLSHPNIIAGIDVGSDQGLHYFAMEYVDGGSATNYIEACEGKMPEAVALSITRQAAAGLHAAHSRGMIHKDIKPDNILLASSQASGSEFVAKLADLGISQNIGATSEDDDDEFWASPPYAAPEVIEGGENDVRSDLYSLGATLFELLAARPPFVAETAQEVFQKHLSAPLPDVRTFRPDVSEGTANLLKRMLARKVEERIDSAKAVIEAIDLLKIKPTASKALPVVVRPKRTPGVKEFVSFKKRVQMNQEYLKAARKALKIKIKRKPFKRKR